MLLLISLYNLWAIREVYLMIIKYEFDTLICISNSILRVCVYMVQIQEVVSAAAGASVKIMSQRGPRIRWVRKNYYKY